MNNIDTAKVLAREELEETIDAFSNVDWMRLRTVAQHYAVYPLNLRIWAKKCYDGQPPEREDAP